LDSERLSKIVQFVLCIDQGKSRINEGARESRRIGKDPTMLRGLAVIHAVANGLDLRTGLPIAPLALPPPPKPAATAPTTAERAIAIVDAAQAARANERGTEADARLGGAMQRYLTKVLPAAAIEANALDLELRVAPGDDAQLRLAKVCARQIKRLCGEQKAAPAIAHVRAVASGVDRAPAATAYRPAVQRGVLAAVRRR
jgi:hypothetical protein